MAERGKLSERNEILVKILERLADQIQKQEHVLEEIIKHQDVLSKDVAIVGANVGSHRGASQRDLDIAITKLQESFTRYRSDMLSLVNEQDHMNKNMVELQKSLNKTNYAMETVNQRIAKLEDNFKAQDKSFHDHYEYTQKQAELLPREIATTNRNMTELHTDTEKSLGKMQHDTQRQLDKMQHDILRHLMVLDSMETTLQTLLVRTEPPEKKIPLFIRMYNGTSEFFKVKVPLTYKRIRLRLTGSLY
jgi:chromosome segregation ATPase